jgi:hypothetical protein
MIDKIKNQKELETKKKRNQIILGIFLVLIMVISTLGYSLMSNEESNNLKKTEKGLKFIKQNGLWNTIIDGRAVSFQYLPSELSEVVIQGQIGLLQYSGKPLYFTALDSGARQVIIFLEPYVLRYQETCVQGSSCSGDLPIKDCSNNIIIPIIEADKTEVYINESCVYLKGDTAKAADAFLYKLFGIN